MKGIKGKIKYSCILFVFLVISITGYAQDNGSTKDFEYRAFDQEKIEQFKTDKDFAYIHQSPPNSLWNSFKDWLTSLLKKIFTRVPEEQLGNAVQVIIQVILWGIAIFALVMLFLNLFKHGAHNIIGRKDMPAEVNYQELEQQVIETNWPVLIDEAINNKRYRTAIRLLFLYTIQQLHNNGLITWNKNKTNREYLDELNQHEIKEAFRNLVMYYNHVWFGDFAIDKSLFEKVHQRFQQFYNTLDKHVEKV